MSETNGRVAEPPKDLNGLAVLAFEPSGGRGFVTLDRIVRNQGLLAAGMLRIIERLDAGEVAPRRVRPADPANPAALPWAKRPSPETWTCPTCAVDFHPTNQRVARVRCGKPDAHSCSQKCGAINRFRKATAAP